jgi:hypothetical protein
VSADVRKISASSLRPATSRTGQPFNPNSIKLMLEG